jgi:hypothetical protein
LGHRGFLGSTAAPNIREILRTHTGEITEGLAVQAERRAGAMALSGALLACCAR